MTNPLHSLWVAVGFLTRVPVGDVTRNGRIDIDMAKAVPWFPFVGIGIGAVVGGVFVLADAFLNLPVASLLAVATGLLITGAFHHDGLADIADAFGGGWTVERRLEILKDSRLGTYGTAALCIAIIGEVVALAALKGSAGVGALIVAHSLGRAMALAAMILARSAGEGMGSDYMERLSPLSVTFGIAAGLIATFIWSPIFPLVTIGVAAIPTMAIVALANRKIGGINGDVLGAITVVSGLAILVISGAT